MRTLPPSGPIDCQSDAAATRLNSIPKQRNNFATNPAVLRIKREPPACVALWKWNERAASWEVITRSCPGAHTSMRRPAQKKAGKRHASHRPEWSYCLQLLRWRSRCFGLVALLSGSRRHTRLSLHRGFVNHGTLFQLPTAKVAFGDKVEVSGLNLSSALPRRDAAGIGLVGPIRGQVVLDVD